MIRWSEVSSDQFLFHLILSTFMLTKLHRLHTDRTSPWFSSGDGHFGARRSGWRGYRMGCQDSTYCSGGTKVSAGGRSDSKQRCESYCVGWCRGCIRIWYYGAYSPQQKILLFGVEAGAVCSVARRRWFELRVVVIGVVSIAVCISIDTIPTSYQ